MKNTLITFFLLWWLIAPYTLMGQNDSDFRIERRLTNQELYDELPNDTTWAGNVIVYDTWASKIKRADIPGTWSHYLPTLEEIRSMEDCIRASYPLLISFADERESTWNLTQPDCYTRYFRQYMFQKNQQGRKVLYLCCISYNAIALFKRDIDLREGPLALRDGGDSYWQATYDVDAKQVLWVHVNGNR